MRRDKRLKLKQSSKSQGDDVPLISTCSVLGLRLLLWAKLNIFYCRIGEVLLVSEALSVSHLKISNLVSLTQQNSALGDNFPLERQLITEFTTTCSVC